MNKIAVARELVKVAKLLMAGPLADADAKINSINDSVRIPPTPRGVQARTPKMVKVDDSTVIVLGRLDVEREFRHPDEYENVDKQAAAAVHKFENAYFMAIDQMEKKAKAKGFRVKPSDVHGDMDEPMVYPWR